jgi:agmatinase
MTSVHLIGLPSDANSSFRRGAALAPAAIRRQLFSPHGNSASESGAELGRNIDLVDKGDLPLANDPGDDALIEGTVARTVSAGARPLLLGGDHAVTFPIMKAIAARHGPVDILHFDAHPDLYDDFEGNPRSHASPFARIMEAGLAKRLVQVGIRTLNAHQRQQAERFGVEIVPMRDFTPAAVPVLTGPVYVSFDIDGLDPAFAPGVSHPEPGGLSVREALNVLARLDAPVVGADIVELNPLADINDLTAVVAAKLAKELAALLARE